MDEKHMEQKKTKQNMTGISIIILQITHMVHTIKLHINRYKNTYIMINYDSEQRP